MAYLVKMGYKMGFQHLFVTEMDEVWVLQGPFPTHNWKLSTNADRVHDISTHIKWRYYLGSHEPIFPIIKYLVSHFIRQNGCSIHDKGINCNLH